MKYLNDLAKTVLLATLPLCGFATPLKVMTLNLANYNDHGHWNKRLQLIVNSVAEAKPDILALQETRFDPDHDSTTTSYQDMAEQILYQLQARGLYLQAQLVTQPAMFYPHGTQGILGTHNYPLPKTLAPENRSYYWEGLSIISNLPVLETGSTYLSKSSDCNDDNRRITQYIKVTYANKPLYIANVHFSGNACFATQMQETINYFNSIVQNQPLMVMGDFNAKPDNAAFNLFDAYGLIDAWHALRPADAGNTSSPGNLTQRIDYIWVSQSFKTALKKPEQVQLEATQETDGDYPSDHLGVSLSLS